MLSCPLLSGTYPVSITEGMTQPSYYKCTQSGTKLKEGDAVSAFRGPLGTVNS